MTQDSRFRDDLSVVGFDDIRLAQFVLPPLTTVQMSQSELARLAFNALLAEVDRETPAPNGTEYQLKTTLVLRESTSLFSGAPKTPVRLKRIARRHRQASAEASRFDDSRSHVPTSRKMREKWGTQFSHVHDLPQRQSQFGH